ncbi:hypothetical protein GQ600_25991 [Phytophthora cactorum]|nr:hypothetical protein GQ600_25991 [Phytophthora cactorum]
MADTMPIVPHSAAQRVPQLGEPVCVHCTRRSAVDTASMCATPQTKTSAVSNAAISAYPDTRQRSIMMHYKPSDPTNFDAN